MKAFSRSCWWGVSAPGRMRTSCGGPLRAGRRTRALRLLQFVSVSLARPKWGSSFKPGPAAFKDPNEQLSTCPFLPSLDNLFFFPSEAPLHVCSFHSLFSIYGRFNRRWRRLKGFRRQKRTKPLATCSLCKFKSN